MKKIFTLFLLAVILFPIFAHALTFRIGENYSLRKEETVIGDLYVAGGNTALSGEVQGDLFAVGANVYVGNRITEDLFVAGGTVNIIGEILGDLRGVGGNIVVSSLVGDDAVIAGSDIRVLPNSQITGDAAFAGGKIIVEGTISGDVEIAGGEVSINNHLSGNVDITADTVVISDGAVIDGNLTYASRRPALISEGAQINGEVVFNRINNISRTEQFLPTLWGTWVFIRVVMLVVSGLLLHAIFRNISTKFVNSTINSFSKNLLKGFLLVAATPVMIFILLLTFVGIPFVFLLLSSLVLLSVIAWVYGSIIIGVIVRRLINRESTIKIDWKSILLGAVIVFLLGFIPYAGLLIKTVLFFAALGGITAVLYEKFLNTR